MANVIEIIVRTTAQGFNRASQEVTRGLGSIRNAALAATAALTGVFSGAAIKNQVEFATQIDDISRKLGIATEALSELQFVAQQQNVAQETLNNGLQRLARRLAEAEQGTGVAIGALEALGIEIENLSGLSLDERFTLIAQAFSQVEDEASRVRIAFQLFDRSGVDLIRVLEGGAAGIIELRQEARRLGLTLSKDTTASAAELGGQITQFQSNIDGLTRSITRGLLPAFNFVFRQFREFTEFLGITARGFSELNAEETAQQLLDVQTQLATSQEALARAQERLNRTSEENTRLFKTRSELVQRLRIEVDDLADQETALTRRSEDLEKAIKDQIAALDGLIGKQGELNDSTDENNQSQQQAANIRIRLLQQQAAAENRIADIRRSSLTETERQKDIELEAARLTIRASEARAALARAETEEQQKAAIEQQKAIADRINALSSQSTEQEQQIKLIEQGARIQQQAAEAEIAALQDVESEREKQIGTIRQQLDELNKQAVAIPVSLDTSALDQQIQALQTQLNNLAGGIQAGAAVNTSNVSEQLARELALRGRALQ